MGGKFHLKLNIGGRPIANKYREGKMKRTLKRELKVPEIAEMEPMGVSVVLRSHVSVDASGLFGCAGEARWL